MISQSTVKNHHLSSFDPSNLLAYNLSSLKASKTRLVSSERSFIKLLEAHEFLLIWFKNRGTLIFQSTVKNQTFSSFDLSSLLAYNFLSLKTSKTPSASSERSFEKLSEAYEFQLIWFKNCSTVISQSTVKNETSSFDPSTYNFLSSKACKMQLVSFEKLMNINQFCSKMVIQ